MSKIHLSQRRPIPRKLLEDKDFQEMLSSLGVSVFITNSLCSHLISFTPYMAELLGGEPLDFKNNPSLWGEVIRSLEGNRIDDILMFALDKKEDLQFDMKIRDLNDIQKKLRITLHMKISEAMQHHEIFGEIQDVTELTEKEIALARMESQEVEIGARIQKRLLLGVPRGLPKGLEIVAKTIPSLKVDGDFYDFNTLSPHIQDFFVGDVMGKGINAALLGAGAKNLFNKSLLMLLTGGKDCPSPESILDLTDSYLGKELIQMNSFITLNYSRIDMEQGLYQFVDCGHNPVIHYSARQGTCWLIKGFNKPIGFMDHQKFISLFYPVQQGDLLFLYSDGITEAKNRNDELFGLDRLIKLIEGFGNLAPAPLVKRILEISFNYSGEGFTDDVTAVATLVEPEREYPSIIRQTFCQTDTSYNLCLPKLDAPLKSCISESLFSRLLPALNQWLTKLQSLFSEIEPVQNSIPDIEELSSEEDIMNNQFESSLEISLRDKKLFVTLIYRGKALTETENHPFDQCFTAESPGSKRKIVGMIHAE